MLLWNYVFLPPLEPLLALPSPSLAAAAADAASFTSAVVVLVLVVDVIIVVHRVPILPILRSSLLALARKAWRAITPMTLATVKLIN